MKKILSVLGIIGLFLPGVAWGLGFDPYPEVYRFWSETYRGHFYTADAGEAMSVDFNYADDIWKLEGTVFTVYDPSICEEAPEGVCEPVYRFWSDAYKHHFYTISEAEKNNIQMNMPEWQYEGIVYSANAVNLGFPYLPLYRFWSNNYRSHFYTISETEKNNIQLNMPEWQYEGIAYYVIDPLISPE